MPGDDGRGGARLPPPSSVSLPDNNKYNSVTTSNQTRQHQPQPAHTEVQSDKMWSKYKAYNYWYLQLQLILIHAKKPRKVINSHLQYDFLC